MNPVVRAFDGVEWDGPGAALTARDLAESWLEDPTP